MILFQNVTKQSKLYGQPRDILAGASVHIPADRRIAFFRPTEHDGQVLIDLIAGSSLPTGGQILRTSRVSFPVGHLGGLAPDLSVRQNVVHVARLYGADEAEVVNFVARVGNFGSFFHKLYYELPPTLKRQLGIILTYSIPFDIYLLAREFNRGKNVSKEFRSMASALFSARAKTSGFIIATNDVEFATEYCNMALLLHQRKLFLFEDIRRAFLIAESSQADA